MPLVILRTSRSRGFSGTYQAGMSILNTGGGLSNSRGRGRGRDRVSAIALESLATMRGRTQKVKSVDDRVAIIKHYILAGEKSPKIRIFTAWAVTDYCGTEFCGTPHETRGEMAAIFWMVKHNTYYLADPLHYDTFDSAERTLELVIGDCDDLAVVAGAVFLHAGYPVRIKVIRTRGNSDFHHVYILVGTPKAAPRSWTPIDPAYYESPGQEAPNIEAEKIYEVD